MVSHRRNSGRCDPKVQLWLELNEISFADAATAFILYKIQKLTEDKKYSNGLRDAVF
jgi:hypothetical protein